MQRDNNILSKWEFLLWYACYMLFAFCFYIKVLYRDIDKLDHTKSLFILGGTIIVCFVIEILGNIKEERNGVSIIVAIVLSLGIYTVLAYYPLKRTLISIVLQVSVFVAILHSMLVLGRRVERRYKRCRYRYVNLIKRRLLLSYACAKWIFAGGMCVIMLILSVQVFCGTAMIRANDNVNTIQSFSQMQILSEDILEKLREEQWNAMNLQERVDLLQEVAERELYYYGITHVLVAGDDLDENTWGVYRDKEKSIVLDLGLLSEGTLEDNISTLLHEVWHSVEHELVDIYANAPKDLQGTAVVRRTQLYAKEFENYKEIAENYYYSMACEVDAREYSKLRLSYYLYKVNQ